MIKKIFPVLAALALFSCSQEEKKEQKEVEVQKNEVTITNHSYSMLDEVKTLHLDLELLVDTEKKVIEGIARHRVKYQGFKKVYFDMNDLNIEKVTLGAKNNEVETKFEIG